MKKRLIYEAPEAEFILVRFERNFLASDGESASLGGMLSGSNGAAGYNGDLDSPENRHTL